MAQHIFLISSFLNICLVVFQQVEVILLSLGLGPIFSARVLDGDSESRLAFDRYMNDVRFRFEKSFNCILLVQMWDHSEEGKTPHNSNSRPFLRLESFTESLSLLAIR